MANPPAGPAGLKWLTKSQLAARMVECEARIREARWPKMLGANIAIAAKLAGKRWIYTPCDPRALTVGLMPL